MGLRVHTVGGWNRLGVCIIRESPVLGGWKQISLAENYSEFDGSEPEVSQGIEFWTQLFFSAVEPGNSEVPRERMVPTAVSLWQQD